MKKSQFNKNHIQGSKPTIEHQKYCKKHLASKKEDVVASTAIGLAVGALWANPIGLAIGAAVGYQSHKAKAENQRERLS